MEKVAKSDREITQRLRKRKRDSTIVNREGDNQTDREKRKTNRENSSLVTLRY